MPETSGHVRQTLWEDEELVLFRTPRDGGALPFLACAPASAQPAPESLARLRHAYALRDQLDPAWAARPSRLELRGGRLALLSEDPGGELLSRLQGRPWDRRGRHHRCPAYAWRRFFLFLRGSHLARRARHVVVGG
jgi:hypothetical protein